MSDDSFVSSDGEQSGASSGEDRYASGESVRRVYHQQVPQIDGAINGAIASRRWLRKNETAYANRPAGDSIFPRNAINYSVYDDSDQFGVLANDNREVVGVYNDADGVPVARIVEQPPPEANANYTHMQSAMGYKLNRAQGIDPDARAKSEIEHISNPEDNVYGEASIVDARRKEATAVEARAVFFNRKHAQAFADQDLSRDDMYDGYNLRAPHAARTPQLEHSWRHVLDAPSAPLLPEGATAHQVVHGEARVDRCETSAPYVRQPHMYAQSEQIRTDNLPLHNTHTYRGSEDTHDQSRRMGEGVVSHTRTTPRRPDRANPAPELNAVTPTGVGAVPRAKVNASVTIDDNARQQQQPTKGLQPHVPSARIQSKVLTRDGSDAIDVGTTPRMLAEACPVVKSAMVRTKAHNLQRQGGDDHTVQRLAEDDGTPQVTARRAFPTEGSRTLSDDDILMTETLFSEPSVPGGKVNAKQTVEGTDVIQVFDKDTRPETHFKGARIRSDEDAPLPTRASVRQPNQLQRATAPTPLRCVVAIGDDRLPTCEAATWHGNLSYGTTNASTGLRRVDEGMDQLDTTRNNASHAASVSAPSSHTSSASHRSRVTTRAQSGKQFLPDRLEQVNGVERAKLEVRVDAAHQLVADRSTPVSALYGSMADLNQRPSIGTVESTGRETPLCWESATRGFVA